MKYGFGVDVGGTTVKLGLLSEAGELLEKWELPSRTENGGENILPDIARSVQDCMARRGLSRDDCLGLGIGVPGPVDASGMVNRCVNLNWGVFNLHDALGILTGLRVRAGNDANCAALGEFWDGRRLRLPVRHLRHARHGHRRRRHRGRPPAHGRARRRRRAWPYRDQCAGQGPLHLRQTRLRRAVCLGERHRPRDEKAPCRIGRAVLPACDGALCLQGRVRRRPRRRRFAVETLEQVFDYLGEALADACCVCDPERIILGGGVSRAGDYLLRGVERHFRAHMFHACKDTQFALATLGNDAGMYGAFRLLA